MLAPAGTPRAAVLICCLLGFWTLGCQGQSQETAAAEGAAPPAATDGVGALGRVEAGDSIVRIAARSLGGQPSIVARVLVKEGDQVVEDQTVAELDSKRQLEAAWRQAQSRIAVAKSYLAQVQAGAKASDVAAQNAEIERIQIELDNAQKEHQRYASLGDNVTAAQVDALRLRVDSTTRALAVARQRLASLTEIRPVDVDVAQAELNEAVRNEERARAEYEASVLRSPIAGRVLKVYAHAGEQVDQRGVLEIAPVDPMYVVAEVAESDIRRVKPGQRATISSPALGGAIQGTVERLELKVLQNQLEPVDPATFSDARVVPVWIKVDDGGAVANLIHLRVDVVIQP
jgi:HlyD family secretion protein